MASKRKKEEKEYSCRWKGGERDKEREMGGRYGRKQGQREEDKIRDWEARSRSTRSLERIQKVNRWEKLTEKITVKNFQELR